MKKEKGISRRDFIKKVGAGTAALSVASIAPRLVKPLRAAEKEQILIGRVMPVTGPLSAFSDALPWVDDRAVNEINRDGGIYIEELKKQLPVKIKIVDTESNPTKAAEVASRLILRDRVDLIYVSSTPATVSPVAGNCERHKVPCVGTMMPVEMFLAGGPYVWSFVASISVMDFMVSFLEMWPKVETNRRVGLLAQNDTDGIHWAMGAKKALEPAGYNVVDLGRFPVGSPDYSAFVTGWKKEKVEILIGSVAPPDFHRAWRQCHREGFIPKIATMGKAILFVSAIEALGKDLGLGLTSECVWHPAYPFKSSLTGYGVKELAEAFEKATGKQWTQPLGGNYSGYEILADALKRAKTLKKENIRKAIADTNMETIQGPTKFTKDNIAITPSGAHQWVRGKKFLYKSELVAKGNYKMLPTTSKLVSIRELRGLS